MRQVDIEKLKILSERGNSKTYISDDNKWIIKFASEGAGNTYADYEKKKLYSDTIASLNISTPKVRDIVCDSAGNYALEYEYIEDKISYSRKVSSNPENVEEYMKKLADFVKTIHNIKVNDECFQSIEELVEKTFDENENFFDKEKRMKVEKIMSKIGNPKTLLHLDLQPGNYIISKKGTMMIDIDTVCYGNPIYDLSFFYYLYHFIEPSHIEKLSRCTIDVATKMWRCFAKYYNNFTSEKEIDDFEEYIKPYSIISAIAMLCNVKIDGPKKFVMKHFDKYIADN